MRCRAGVSFETLSVISTGSYLALLRKSVTLWRKYLIELLAMLLQGVSNDAGR